MRNRDEITVAVERLTRRSDFLAASRGARVSVGAFVLQSRPRGDSGAARVGFTVSRQVGNAVERNRVRRRLREVVRLVANDEMRSGHDYVLIGRRAALAEPFDEMRRNLHVALGRVHARGPEHGAGGTGDTHKRPLHETGSPRPRPHREPRKA